MLRVRHHLSINYILRGDIMLKKLLENSKYTVVFTGAGMSTESGLPDFRSAAKGLWKMKDPSQYASIDALYNNRKEFTEFYRIRIENLLKHEPHKGHYILADLEKKGIVKSIITQNVDGYHKKAGSENVMELHGRLYELFCLSCRASYPCERYLEEGGVQCRCGGFIRPSVVLFGEGLPEDAMDKAYKETMKADLFIVLGSSLQVSPANQYPLIAKRNGAKLVIINMEPTIMDSYFDIVVNDCSIGEYLDSSLNTT